MSTCCRLNTGTGLSLPGPFASAALVHSTVQREEGFSDGPAVGSSLPERRLCPRPGHPGRLATLTGASDRPIIPAHIILASRKLLVGQARVRKVGRGLQSQKVYGEGSLSDKQRQGRAVVEWSEKLGKDVALRHIVATVTQRTKRDSI